MKSCTLIIKMSLDYFQFSVLRYKANTSWFPQSWRTWKYPGS